MPELLDALQWPAMASTLLASWEVGSQHHRKTKDRPREDVQDARDQPARAGTQPACAP